MDQQREDDEGPVLDMNGIDNDLFFLGFIFFCVVLLASHYNTNVVQSDQGGRKRILLLPLFLVTIGIKCHKQPPPTTSVMEMESNPWSFTPQFKQSI